MESNVQLLLSVLKSHAPDEVTANDCDEMLAAMEADGMEESFIEMALCNAILTGLKFGNWPWKIMGAPFNAAL